MDFRGARRALIFTLSGVCVCGFPLGSTAGLQIISQMPLSITFISTFPDEDLTQLYGFLCFSKKMKHWNWRFCDLTNVLVEVVLGRVGRKIVEP